MGGSSSTTREITIEKEDEGDHVTFKVTEAAIQRIRGEVESQAQARAEAASHSIPQPQLRQSAIEDSGTTKQQVMVPVEEYIDWDLIQEKLEEEIKNVENDYEKRLSALEQKNIELGRANIDQFKQAVEEMEKKFITATGPPVCQDLEEKVLDCYKESQGRTLECSPIIKSYTGCVDKCRQNIMSQKG